MKIVVVEFLTFLPFLKRKKGQQQQQASKDRSPEFRVAIPVHSDLFTILNNRHFEIIIVF